MEEKNIIEQSINDNALDLKAEVDVANLIESGLPEELFYFHPKGIFSRNFRFDILEKYTQLNEEGEIIGYHLDISREGLYDMLPEGLFHQTEVKDPFKKVTEMVDEYKRQQEEEADARKFFSPLEQAFYRLRLMIELKERRAFKGFSDPTQQKVLKDKLGLFKESLHPVQLMILLYLLPISYKIVGDLLLTEKCFEAILGEKVHIRYANDQFSENDASFVPGLGETSLGVNFIMGEAFHDFIPSIEVIIGPISSIKIVHYLKEGKYNKIVSMLCDYFIPMELKVEISLEVMHEEQAFSLGSGSHLGRMGLTSRL